MNKKKTPEGNVTRMEAYRDEKKKKHPLLRYVLLLLLFFLIVALVVLYVFRDELDLNRVKRAWSYRGASKEEGAVSFEINTGNGNRYAGLGEDLCTATINGLTIYERTGDKVGSSLCTLNTPMVLTGKRVALSYDVGGTNLTCMNDSGKTVLSVETEGSILDADVSAADAVCYAAVIKGYRSVITVYDKDMTEIYRWYSSTQYMNQCAVSGNAAYLAAIALGQSDGTFESTAVLFSTSEEEPQAKLSLGDQMIWDLNFIDDQTLCAIGESGITWFRLDGSVTASYQYGDVYVRDYAKGSGFVALSENPYQAGNRYSLLTVSSDGTQLGSCYLGEEVYAVSAAGNYVGVLTPSGLQIFNQYLKPYAQSEDIGTATDLVMRDDGTAFLIDNGSARLFVPES